MSFEDRVILRRPVHNLEVELFLSVVLAIAETNIKCYSTQWVVSASWDDSMERTICWFEEL
jgi:hypothetical protein